MSRRPAPGLIRLAPIPDVSYACPECGTDLTATDWYMPGMRTLAALDCPSCDRSFFGDLPIGDAWHAPVLLDRETGQVHAERDDFFSGWLRTSYANRSNREVPVDVDRRRQVEDPAVLNCLDAMYGHSLLKLLSAQHYVDDEGTDLILVVPRILEWCVPDRVAEVWAVDLPLSRGFEWNDALATTFTDLLDEYESVDACVVRPHPEPGTFDLERFSGVTPFPLDQWDERRPTITFVWRDDRHWSPIPPAAIVRNWLGATVTRSLETNSLVARLGEYSDGVGRWIQRRRVRKLAGYLRERLPEVDFAVAGLGGSGGLGGIEDLRVAAPDADEERALCRRYADSHVVVGVHGSNMLLPSGHAGAAVDLLPDRRWGNLGQDLLPRTTGAKPTLFHYRMLPLDASPEMVADVICAVLESRTDLDQTMF